MRFGIDGVKNVDWSGRVSPPPTRISSWQFDANDQLAEATWKCTTREETYWDTPYEPSLRPTSTRQKVTGKGILIEYDTAPGEVRVSTGLGAFSFTPSTSLLAAPLYFLDNRAEVRIAPAAVRFSTTTDDEDYPSLVVTKDGALWMAWQGWTPEGDRIYVRHRTGTAWSRPEALTPRGDYFRTAVAQDRTGKIWVIWAARTDSNFDLYARTFDGEIWSPAERLTAAPGSDIYHSLVSDAAGNLYLAYQSSRNGNFDIYTRIYDGKSWSNEIQVSSDPANDWEPAIAAAPDGRVTVLWDTYANGNYDIVSRTFQQGKLGPIVPITRSGAFEARVSAQYDAQGRLWMAWEEGDWNWGKDYGNLVVERGRGLMVRRQVRVGVLASGVLTQPSAPLVDAVPEDFRQAFQHARLVLDGQGRPWVFFRYRANLPQKESGARYRTAWRPAVSRYQNSRWLPMIEFPEGWGRQDAPLAAVEGRHGGLEVAWISDGRLWPFGLPKEQDLWVTTIPATPGSSAPDLVAYKPPSEDSPSVNPTEVADLARVRAYRTKTGGRNLRIVRGDLHRHTDLSWDGNRDGSLDDSYRYAMDAASLDFLGVCDHQAGVNSGISIAYHWAMIQKAADLFAIPGRFAPLYSYERSLGWPNGHRNVFFAHRGNPILQISEAENRREEGAGKLYHYLRQLGGLTSSHTTASGAGTDFRDSDVELEPVVEIYQGCRNNFEGPGVPRGVPEDWEKRFGAGFVQNAWAKGIKMGVQASSDHFATHISYGALYVNRVDRHAVFEALRARHTFAATDNFIIDFHMGEHFMGDIFSSRGPLPLKAYIRGTAPLASVTLIRNNRVIYTAPGAGDEMSFSYTDREPQRGESWYYLRVEQKDGQLAWGSPIWVSR